jgi:Holliday junction resolvase
VGHLIGDRGLVQMLASKGIDVVRLSKAGKARPPRPAASAAAAASAAPAAP